MQWHVEEERKRHLEYNRIRRERQDDADRFYNTPDWRRARKAYITLHPFCQRCGNPAQVVDHRIPIKDGGDKTAETNLQALCGNCHRRKTAKEQKGNPNRKLPTNHWQEKR
jgi:5-methylcytosine-specific restriction protein A